MPHRERKRAAEFRASAEDSRRRLEAALREQRQLVRKLGEAERSMGGSTAARAAARKAAAEQEYWSEEAGRRFAGQQDELVALREANEHLQVQLAAAVPAETASRYESTIKELQQMVHFYERRLAQANISSSGSCGLQVRHRFPALFGAQATVSLLAPAACTGILCCVQMCRFSCGARCLMLRGASCTTHACLFPAGCHVWR